MAHLARHGSAPLTSRPAGGSPQGDLQALADALQACDGQLHQVVEIIDQLAHEADRLALAPLGRRPWELLARAGHQAQAATLSGARHTIEVLRRVTERFAGAIDLLRGMDAEVAPLTFAVAKETVAAHLEICRRHLLDLGRQSGVAGRI